MSNDSNDKLLFDDLNPIERIEYLTSGKSAVIKKIQLVLLCLYLVDYNLKKILKRDYNFYLCGDSSVGFALTVAGNFQTNEQNLKSYLILLNESGLIYRFTHARKFCLEDKSIKQLRINSWGSEYINHYKLSLPRSTKIKLNKRLLKYFNDNKNIYKQLEKTLNGKISKTKTRSIENLNSSVGIKLLS